MCQRTRAAHDTDIARRTDPPRNDANLRFARSDEAGAVRADESRAPFLDEGIHPRHVENWDALGDGDDELDPSVGGFHDRIRRIHRRHVDHGRIRAGLGDGARHGIEDRDAVLESLTALSRRDPRDDAGAVLHHLLCVERSIAAGDPLDDERRLLIDEDAHAAFPPFASWTARCTASSMSVIAEKPFSLRILTAISSLVPVRRMTMGSLSGFCFVAVTMPLATSSVRVIPPKILKRMTFTFGSDVIMRSALTTFSGFDDPPMSRKLAGSPP